VKAHVEEMTSQTQDVTPVTVDNFAQAESDLYFGNAVKEAGGVGKFFHNRAPVALDKQLVIRMNRDTLYSSAVFDLNAGPVTIALPDPANVSCRCRSSARTTMRRWSYMRPRR
jgi:hypothetical protein